MTDNLPAVVARTDAKANSIELAPAAWQLAHRVAGTEFVPSALRGKPEAVLACILSGHEMGIGPMQSLQKIHVIEGRPAPAAELMRALVLDAGHEIWFEEQSSTRCIMGGRRAGGTRETKVTWTLDDAKRAGLVDRQNWRKYPRAMLLARATAELCRAVFPDVLAGLSYTVEELTDGDVLDAELEAEVTAAPEPAPDPGLEISAGHDATAPPLPNEVDDEDDIADADVVEPQIADETPPERPQAVEGEGGAMFAPDPEPPIDTGPRLTGPQVIALRFEAMGITDRDIRLTMTSDLVGRPITSGNDLTPDEVRIVLDALADDGTEPGTVPTDAGQNDGAAPTPAPHAEAPSSVETEGDARSSGRASSPESGRRQPPPEEWTGDQWRDVIRRRGVKAAALLKQARELSGRGVATLDDIAGTGHADELYAFVEAHGR